VVRGRPGDLFQSSEGEAVMILLASVSNVGMVILDLQICLSRFCIAARVMALRREISGEL